jgi:U3 small nucleolar RNA-associated protein 25
MSDLNDITRLKETYTIQSPKSLPKHMRQNIIIQKFKTSELEFIYNLYCNHNLFGSINLPKIQPNRAKEICRQQGAKITLRRLPNINSYEHVDNSRFNFFTRKIWDSLYQNNTGYTILFVPSYFDFIKLRTFIKGKNARVSFISEYSEKKSC